MTVAGDIFSLHNLRVGYGPQVVLKEINLKLKKGSLVCFMGPNGAGKSTLLRTMAGFQPPLSGEINFNGKNVQEYGDREKAHHISVVLTERLNAGQMTGREIIASGRYPYTGWFGKLSDQDNTAIHDAMVATDCQDLAHTYYYEMSDGQRQKIMIARALCQQTEVILLDEPTAHLDLNNRVAVVTLLRKLAHEKNRAILMTTHELDLALQLADRIWLAETGGTVLEGIPEDLVLNGRIDQVFQFKGYDLRTGNILIQRSGKIVSMEGEGFIYLWTRNALERNGYSLENDTGPTIRIKNNTDNPEWFFNNETFTSLELLMEAVDRYFN